VILNESKTVGQADMRKMQNNQEAQQSNGHLRKPEAQTEAGNQGRIQSVKQITNYNVQITNYK